MAKSEKSEKYQNSQEIFCKFIPGYEPGKTIPYEEAENCEDGVQKGISFGRELASEFKEALRS